MIVEIYKAPTERSGLFSFCPKPCPFQKGRKRKEKAQAGRILSASLSLFVLCGADLDTLSPAQRLP